MRAFVACFVALCASACRDWPQPSIVSVTPDRMVASAATRVEIRADLALPTTVDYAEGTVEADTAAQVWIGDQQVGDGRYPPDGVFEVEVPTVFQPGTYPVRIVLGDGREARLSEGFTVTAGQWPEGYTIDPIGAQQKLVPFDVTVRATGANAASFSGNVRLSVPTGATVGPALSAPFVDGVLTQRVVVNSTRTEEILIVTDVAGNRATSAAFPLQ